MVEAAAVVVVEMVVVVVVVVIVVVVNMVVVIVVAVVVVRVVVVAFNGSVVDREAGPWLCSSCASAGKDVFSFSKMTKVTVPASRCTEVNR